MGRIARLPAHVANQIAAGEVVERPAAVVKELVENALDAGATRILVEFRQGGKNLIRVTDNGCGMDRDDALLALERHATSKIRLAADLDRLHTFGFRGEALASIASVSDFTLRTRPPEQPAGTEVRLNGHREPVVRDCGMPAGTSIEVASLFRTVPARRQFLKTDRTEAAHIVEYCRLLAVAHPEVALTLIEDQRTVFQSPECAGLRERVGEVFGRRLAEDLLDLNSGEVLGGSAYRVAGLLGPPSLARATRADIRIFVNRRPIESRLLTYALLESYHTYVPRGRFPVAFLFLEVAPERVDVNVHPTKREVRFRDEPQVRRLVMEAVTARLQQAERQQLLRAAPVAPLPPAQAASPAAPLSPSPVRTPPAPRPSLAAPRPQPASASLPPAVAREPAPAPVVRAIPAAPPGEVSFSAWRFLGQLRRRLVLFANGEGLIVLHATAAWERILYERVLASLDGETTAQTLLFPPLLELDPLLDEALQELGPLLAAAGFRLEPFGRRLYRLEALPAWLGLEAGESFVRDLLQLARERGLSVRRRTEAQEALARFAAEREARQQPSPSEPGEAHRLLQALFSTTRPLQDPQGRPTFHETRWAELEKRLARDLGRE